MKAAITTAFLVYLINKYMDTAAKYANDLRSCLLETHVSIEGIL